MSTAASFRRTQLQTLALNRLRRVAALEPTQIREHRTLVAHTVFSIFLDCRRLGVIEEASPHINKIRELLNQK